MKRKLLFFAVKSVVFLLLFCILWQRISWVVSCYGTIDGEPDRRNCLFFSLPKNTVDVLFAGTSHVYCSYIPQQIFDSTGITSASIASSSQSYQNTYYLLKEALKYQKPEIVVLDIHNITSSVDEKIVNFRLHYTSGISIMPDLTLNKFYLYREIKQSRSGWAKKMSVYDAVPLLEYRNERDRNSDNRLEAIDLFFSPTSGYHTFGFYPTTTVAKLENIVPNKTTKNRADLEKSTDFQYLQKIKELLDRENITLVMGRAPYSGEDFDDYHLYEQAEEWMEEQDIIYIDYFNHMDELKLDLEKDFRDADHLNYLGAKKLTAYFTKYLQEHFDLKNHKGESKYNLWENNDYDYTPYEKKILEQVK